MWAGHTKFPGPVWRASPTLCIILVGLRIEFGVQEWSPNLEKDKLLSEKALIWATKIIQGFRKLSYNERLRRTWLTRLEERRIRGDLIETFKIVKGKSKVDYRLLKIS